MRCEVRVEAEDGGSVARVVDRTTSNQGEEVMVSTGSCSCERGDIQGDEIDSYKAPSTATLGEARATASTSATRSKYGRLNDVDGTFLVGFEERTSESKDSQRQLS